MREGKWPPRGQNTLPRTTCAYRADGERFRAGAGKPLAWVTLADWQEFANSWGELSAGATACLCNPEPKERVHSSASKRDTLTWRTTHVEAA